MNLHNIEYKSMNNWKILFISAYFIFNFYDRNISSIFLILALIISIIDYKELVKTFKKYNRIVISIILFSVWIIAIGFYHNSPINEIDNYLRFLILIPLLSISIQKENLLRIIFFSSIFGLAHYVQSYAYDPLFSHRFSGTSSSAITYGNLSAVFLVLCVYFLSEKLSNKKKYYLVCSAAIFLFLFAATGTRGPIIGLFFSLLFLLYFHRKILLSVISISVFVVIFTIPNNLGDRIKMLSEINFTQELDDKFHSTSERMYYFSFGKSIIENNILFGVGPHNIEPQMHNTLISQKISNITPRDHLHNDYIDISAKFGLPSLFLLLLIYIVLMRLSHTSENRLTAIILIMLICSQLTQSQFAHHQAISFFILLLYLSINLIQNNKNSTTSNLYNQS